MERISLSQIDPAPYNPRRALNPGDPEFEALANSLDEFGLVEPLIWNKRTGTLVGGHQRLAVLRARGETEVEVSVVDLSVAKEKALNVALNKIQGEWDKPQLAALLDELLQTQNLDIGLTGFTADEAEDLIGELLDHQREDVQDSSVMAVAAADAVTQVGDLIELGHHRLFCGDATSERDVRTLMAGERALLFATDPPYLVDYGENERHSQSRSPAADWDRRAGSELLYEQFIGVAIKHALRLDAAWYHWHASRTHGLLDRAWAKHGALQHAQIILDRGHGLPSRSWYMWQHEPCLMGWMEGNKPPRVDHQRLSTVWRFLTPRGMERPDHPTPKPIEVFEIPMRQHTRPMTTRRVGGLCYEPFAGSGTQVIAAERLGRRCFAMELDPRYCDLIVRRFIRFAGEGAVSAEIASRYRIDGKEVA
ncbi:MAG: DNA methyltransferase [Planctomycetota bacterium]